MSDNSQTEAWCSNWRGPLLAGGFSRPYSRFCCSWHQNSRLRAIWISLREDPYGTSLLFDAYARAGYQVKRSQDEDSLSDQNAEKATASLSEAILITTGKARKETSERR